MTHATNSNTNLLSIDITRMHTRWEREREGNEERQRVKKIEKRKKRKKKNKFKKRKKERRKKSINNLKICKMKMRK